MQTMRADRYRVSLRQLFAAHRCTHKYLSDIAYRHRYPGACPASDHDSPKTPLSFAQSWRQPDQIPPVQLRCALSARCKPLRMLDWVSVHRRSQLPSCIRRAASSSAAPRPRNNRVQPARSEEHTSELQSRENLVCRLLLEKKKKDR